jgi:hypothetical protein
MMFSPATSPSHVVRELFEAIDTEQWTDAANCMDPDEIRSRHDRALTALRGEMYTHVVDVIAAASTSEEAMPETSVTTAQLSLQRAGPDATALIVGISSVEELERIGPDGLMARLIARAVGSFEPHADETADAGSRPLLPDRLIRVVLGETHETDELAHVVYRRLLQRGETTTLLEPVRVISLQRTPSGWRASGPKYDHLRLPSPTSRRAGAVLRRDVDRYESMWL